MRKLTFKYDEVTYKETLVPVVRVFLDGKPTKINVTADMVRDFQLHPQVNFVDEVAAIILQELGEQEHMSYQEARGWKPEIMDFLTEIKELYEAK